MTNFDIEVIKYHDKLNFIDFDCGIDEINQFLKQKGPIQEKNKVSRIYIIQINNHVIAFSAVFCSHLYYRLQDQEQEFRVPGICLGQLGVDLKFQNKGLGSILINHSISLANKISNYAACRVLYCEARNEAIPFYERHHFRMVKALHDRNKMALDLKYFNNI
ncbi:MAG TPA: GNAT family N-acetyltransferase [Candidatus Deferrimicrobium sp.]|nr:GNAT family N-acetyltransferase [Candidatus Deferrimicrobium sp.]